jgi:hypothetical protein
LSLLEKETLELKRKFLKKLDILNESGKEFTLCFTNEQVMDDDVQFNDSNPNRI